METDQRQDSKPEAAAELRRYIRFQQAGWLMFCAWPVGMIAAAYFDVNPTQISIISVLWVMAAIIIFAIGHTGKQELKEREHTE